MARTTVSASPSVMFATSERTESHANSANTALIVWAAISVRVGEKSPASAARAMPRLSARSEFGVFVLRGGELVALTPNDTSGGVVEGVLHDLRLFGNTRVETFGCRSRSDGRVDFVEVLIERVDSDATTDANSPAYTGGGLAVSYVVRTSDPDWAGIGAPGERVALPEYDGGTALPTEILEDLDAAWLCMP